MNGRPHNGEISSGVGGPIDVRNTFEPILPVQDLESICEQASISMASTDVHDMIQPILPPQAFASSNGLSHGFHPAQPVQAYDPIHGQASIDMANTDVHDMIQPIHSPQVFISSNNQDAQRNDLEMDKLHHMFSCAQATDPMESQAPTRNRFIEPMRADTQSMYVHDRPHSPFTPVFAM